MATNNPPSEAVLRKAVELRAAGNSWDAVGAAVGFAAETVRKWPMKYPARWRKAARAAETRTLMEATAEAVYMAVDETRKQALEARYGYRGSTMRSVAQDATPDMVDGPV